MRSDILWTAKDIVSVTQGRLTGQDFGVTGISIDTRSLQKGDLFIALKGPNFDGHAFADDAVAKGASGVLVETGGFDNAVTVPDTFAAMQDLGAAARRRSKAKIIAVTGSVGKTSVKAMLAAAFSAVGETHSAEASLNNHWGVPLSLARMPLSAQYGVFEIGMNHANEISPLSKLVAPHVAIITTIASAHIEHLKTLENIAMAKAEIFLGMDSGGIAILPRDNAQFAILLAKAHAQGLQKIISFGEGENADVQLLSLEEGNGVSMLDARIGNSETRFKFGIPGRHQAVNALAVLAALKALDIPVDKALPALENLEPVAGRGNETQVTIRMGQPPVTIIDETHNASPIAVEAALKTLAGQSNPGCRVVVLGDMLELGLDAPALHAGLADAVKNAKPGKVLLCGKMMRYLADELPPEITRHYADSAVLCDDIIRQIQPGDIVLVKGSRGSKMKRVIDALHALGQLEKPFETLAETRRNSQIG